MQRYQQDNQRKDMEQIVHMAPHRNGGPRIGHQVKRHLQHDVDADADAADANSRTMQ